MNPFDISRPGHLNNTDRGFERSKFSHAPEAEGPMSDKLLLLFGNWFLVEAEGTTAILAACLITGYVGLLSIVALFTRSPRITKYYNHGANDVLGNNVSDIDRRR